jgi:hypothetical protein
MSFSACSLSSSLDSLKNPEKRNRHDSEIQKDCAAILGKALEGTSSLGAG